MMTDCPHMKSVPIYDGDLFSDDVIRNPLPVYEKLRELGSVVYSSELKFFIATHYEAVREVLKNHQAFLSSKGTAGDIFGCEFYGVSTIQSDPPLHTHLRRSLAAPLLPGVLISAES